MRLLIAHNVSRRHPGGMSRIMDFLHGPLGAPRGRSIRNDTIEWVELKGEEAGRRQAAEHRDPVDFVFIEGDHTYESVRSDWEAWSSLVAPGGVIALHDSHPTPARPIHEAGSVRFTREHVLTDPRFTVVEVVNTLTVVGRRGAR